MNPPTDYAQSEAAAKTTVALGPLLATCLNTNSTKLPGRVLVTWIDEDGADHEAWLPKLSNLAVREHDRVMISRPSNAPEFIVTGVLDGLHPGASAEARRGPNLEMKPDEALNIQAADGTPLIEVTLTDEGPRIRLLVDDGVFDFPGRLKLKAQDLEFEATSGEFRVSATGDVKVQGEMVRLN